MNPELGSSPAKPRPASVPVTPSSSPPAHRTAPRSRVRAWLRRLALRTGVYPHISFTKVPFKIYEYRELLRHCRISPTDRVLDLGCGIGSQTLMVGRRAARIVGVDVSPAAIRVARAQADAFADLVDATFLEGPLEEQGLPAASFDKVLSFCVIEHIPNCDEVLAEIARLLVPGGELILSADALEGIDDPGLIEKHRRENQVERYFRPDTLRARLERAGFEVESLYPIFRGDYARRTFAEGIRRGFDYGYFPSLGKYARLRISERRAPQGRGGLFLIARCRTPGGPGVR